MHANYKTPQRASTCVRTSQGHRERPRGRRDSRIAAHHFFFSFVFSTPFSHNVFKPFTAYRQTSAQANISLREHRRDYSPMSNRLHYSTNPIAWGKKFALTRDHEPGGMACANARPRTAAHLTRASAICKSEFFFGYSRLSRYTFQHASFYQRIASMKWNRHNQHMPWLVESSVRSR